MAINDWPPEFGDDFRADVLEAVDWARSGIRWKPGKDAQHHKKRIRLGHLSPNTTLDEYESIITRVLNSIDHHQGVE